MQTVKLPNPNQKRERPGGSRVVAVWRAGSDAPINFLVTEDSAIAASRAWKSGVQTLELVTTDETGRRSRVSLRASSVDIFAVDEPAGVITSVPGFVSALVNGGA